MKTARIWNALKNPIRVAVAGTYAYEEIQWARDLDALNMKDFVNQSIAGVVSLAVITLSLETIIDCAMRLRILREAHLDDKDREGKEIVYALGVALFSLGAAIYTGINFFDQRHTGIVALLGFGVAILKAYLQCEPLPDGLKRNNYRESLLMPIAESASCVPRSAAVSSVSRDVATSQSYLQSTGDGFPNDASDVPMSVPVQQSGQSLAGSSRKFSSPQPAYRSRQFSSPQPAYAAAASDANNGPGYADSSPLPQPVRKGRNSHS